MSTDEKRIQFGNEGEELEPAKTENLSSVLHQRGDAALPDARIGEEVSQRGRQGSFDRHSGAVLGSGSDAGGGGTPGEDYDQDSEAGSTKPPAPASRQ